MRAAGLHAIATLMTSEAILISSATPRPEFAPLMETITSRIAGVLASDKYVLCQYNVPRDRLSSAVQITPGRRAPTVSTIDTDGWVAVSVMVEKKEAANVMDQLVAVGATDIFTIKLQNCRV